MLIFDGLTIVICAVLLLLTIASVLSDTFLKGVPKEDYTSETDSLKPVSVVVISDNSAHELNKHLPVFLSQDYPAGYEVIVVVSKNEDDTDDVLKTYASRHGNLYTTFVPDSSRYMSRHKLAITLGVKAAKHNMILLTDADCHPNSDKWILSMAETSLNGGASIVVGYSNYEDGTKRFRQFDLLHRQYSLLREVKNGRPYAIAGRNLLFSKDMFLQGKGFQGNLKYLRGENEFLVNKYGAEHTTAIATSPDSRLTEDEPMRREYMNRCIFYAETRRHLAHSLRHRLAFNVDMLSLYLCLMASLAVGVYAGLNFRWIELAVAVFSFIVPFVTRSLMGRRAISFFGLAISSLAVVPYELGLVWHNFAVAVRHKRADKTEFISHKS